MYLIGCTSYFRSLLLFSFFVGHCAWSEANKSVANKSVDLNVKSSKSNSSNHEDAKDCKTQAVGKIRIALIDYSKCFSLISAAKYLEVSRKDIQSKLESLEKQAQNRINAIMQSALSKSDREKEVIMVGIEKASQRLKEAWGNINATLQYRMVAAQQDILTNVNSAAASYCKANDYEYGFIKEFIVYSKNEAIDISQEVANIVNSENKIVSVSFEDLLKEIDKAGAAFFEDIKSVQK